MAEVDASPGSARGAWRWIVALTLVLLGATTAWSPAGAASFSSALPTEVDGDAPPNPCAVPADPDGDDPSIVPNECWGRFPSGNYDIGFDEGAWNHLSRKVYGTFTDLSFQGARSSTALALWLVEWAYAFGVQDRLGGPAVDIARRYQSGIIGPLGLGHLAWTYAVAWAAVAALRGRLTMAAGELAISILAAGLAGILLANPAGYMQGTTDTMSRLSGALLATGTGQPPPDGATDAEAVMEPLQAEIHSAFVEEPYDYLNWGGPLSGSCAAARDEILATGPHGADDEPRSVMADAGCEAQAEFNERPDSNRLFGALLTFGAATLMAVLVGLVALTVVVAQVIAVTLWAVAPFALLAGILPGAGRELAWRWLTALARAVLAVVGMSFVLSILLLTVNALLEGSDDVGLVERFALVNMAVVAMYVTRKRILAAGHNLAGSVGQRLATRRAGSDRPATPWLANPAVAGATGFAIGAGLGPDRSSRSSRLASAAGRNYLANRRVHRSQRAAEERAQRRASTTTTRQRTEISTDGDGQPVLRSAVTIDGPAATSRRARAARTRLETRSARNVEAQARRRDHGWERPASEADEIADEPVVDDEPPVEAEEA
ncbi:MAG TPA: type IV secretion system protein [Candidatus Limnocylindria bacterium]